MSQQVNKFYLLLLAILPLHVSGNTELSDPTRPATYLVEDAEPIFIEEFALVSKEKINWKLSAVRISEKDKTAIINGKLVRVGDEVSNAKVLEIKLRSVVIDHEDHKLIVRLFKNQVKKDYKSAQ